MAHIVLGTDTFCDADVEWQVTSRANRQLMVVGLLGMGKTEALLNICEQLVSQSITPIVFSYHPDIEERLAQRQGKAQLLDHQQLGFNPTHVDQQSPHAHIDKVGLLRLRFRLESALSETSRLRNGSSAYWRSRRDIDRE